MYNNDVGKGGVRVYEANEVEYRVELVRAPFYFMNLLPTSSLLPPAGSCDRMLGVHAHAPHVTSRSSARGSCGHHRRSPLRPRSTHTPAMPSDATGGWPCLHPPCVSSRAHHPAHYSAHGHMQRRAYMRALAHVYMRNVAYAHSTSLTRSRSTRAHAHAHSQTDGITHRYGIPQERHT